MISPVDTKRSSSLPWLFLTDQQGSSAVEYAVMTTLIASLLIPVVHLVGDKGSAVFESFSNSFSTGVYGPAPEDPPLSFDAPVPPELRDSLFGPAPEEPVFAPAIAAPVDFEAPVLNPKPIPRN